MYNDIFAIDEIPFNQRQGLNEQAHPFLLKNYLFLGPELDSELYYNYFLRKCLFDIDIMELEDFFKFQFENSGNSEKLRMLTEYKIIPDIDKVINYADVNGIALEYRDEKVLEYGFVITEGIIKNKKFDFQLFYSHVAVNKLKENLKQRKIILFNLINTLKGAKSENELNKLVWSGKPAHLAFIIKELADNGYIKMPFKASGDPYPTEFARQILNSFTISKGGQLDTLVRFANSDDEKLKILKENFIDKGFEIPNSKLFK